MMEPTTLERELLLSWITGKDRAWIKVHPEHKLSLMEQVRFRGALYKRRKGIPMAYILGYQDWMGMRLQVNKHTLIPRDETEILCDHIQNEKRSYEVKSVLDVGTGSGAIALCLKGLFPKSLVTGVDISKKALQVAKKNAKDQSLDIDFIYSDMLSSIKEGSRFDIITANLPYVPEDMIVARDLDFEPDTALFSGKEGLIHIQRLADELKEKKIIFKELWLEFLPQQVGNIEQIFSSTGMVELKKDLSGQIFFACIKFV